MNVQFVQLSENQVVVNTMFHTKLAIKLKNLKLIPRIQLAC